MRIARSKSGWFTGLLAAVVGLAGAGDLAGQHSKMPSTLRYGSGFLDVPAASVLPHMAITGTYSGFAVSLDDRVYIDPAGRSAGFSGTVVDDWRQDGSVAIGLFDRVEVGASFQHFDDADKGGTIFGGFGRVALIRPENNGLGLAIGGRFVSSPTFDGVTPSRSDYMPPRLGFPDNRFAESYTGVTNPDNVKTNFSPYIMSNFQLRGFEVDWLPQHDFSFGLGYGEGMFGGTVLASEGEGGGDELDWYGTDSSRGWMAASAVHIGLGETAILNLIGEYNGWDVNAGLQLDYNGIRVGGFILGANYKEDVTEYRSAKYGVLASLALCPADGGLCSPRLLDRIAPDTVQLPAPPPDTVIVEREVPHPPPATTDRTICLATGQNMTVQRGPDGTERIPLGALSGTYAGEADWFNATDSSLEHGNFRYNKTGGQVSLNCGDITRVGEWMGVPLFAETSDANADPIPTIYVPVTPGSWQPYERPERVRG